jgi:hypothetical protein
MEETESKYKGLLVRLLMIRAYFSWARAGKHAELVEGMYPYRGGGSAKEGGIRRIEEQGKTKHRDQLV